MNDSEDGYGINHQTDPAAEQGRDEGGFDAMPATELMRLKFSPRKWAVPGLLGQGLFLLSGPPKGGKSWLAKAVALAVARGGPVLGKFDTEAGDALYLALEDDRQRLQDRIGILTGGRPELVPARCHFATRCPPGDDGLIEVARWLKRRPAARLVVIDTLAVFAGGRGGGDVYADDYARLRKLKRLADKFGVCVLALTHTRKLADADALNTVMGTSGVTGAADGVLILRRKRFSDTATVDVTGRDVKERRMVIRFRDEDCQWVWAGDASADTTDKPKPLPPAQRQVIDALAEHGPMTPARLAAVVNKKPDAVKMLLSRMAKDGRVVSDGGVYKLPADDPADADAADVPGDPTDDAADDPGAWLGDLDVEL